MDDNIKEFLKGEAKFYVEENRNKMKKNRSMPQGDRNIINYALKKRRHWLQICIKRTKRIERTKKKLFKIIVEYNVEHVDDKEKTSAYRLADTLYRKYTSFDKKDGLTLYEIEVLNKFYE